MAESEWPLRGFPSTLNPTWRVARGAAGLAHMAVLHFGAGRLNPVRVALLRDEASKLAAALDRLADSLPPTPTSPLPVQPPPQSATGVTFEPEDVNEDGEPIGPVLVHAGDRTPIFDLEWHGSPWLTLSQARAFAYEHGLGFDAVSTHDQGVREPGLALASRAATEDGSSIDDFPTVFNKPWRVVQAPLGLSHMAVIHFGAGRESVYSVALLRHVAKKLAVELGGLADSLPPAPANPVQPNQQRAIGLTFKHEDYTDEGEPVGPAIVHGEDGPILDFDWLARKWLTVSQARAFAREHGLRFEED